MVLMPSGVLFYLRDIYMFTMCYKSKHYVIDFVQKTNAFVLKIFPMFLGGNNLLDAV